MVDGLLDALRPVRVRGDGAGVAGGLALLNPVGGGIECFLKNDVSAIVKLKTPNNIPYSNTAAAGSKTRADTHSAASDLSATTATAAAATTATS